MEVKATFQHGVAKPVEPLELPEGTLVTISFDITARPTLPACDVAKILAEIAALPSENTDLMREEDIDKSIYDGDIA